MQKALIYCRVSTEEQAEKGFSLDAQEKYCADFAKRNGYKIAGVFRDEGKSGTTLDRPALKDLLSTAQEDQSIAAVIVQETDRLARNTKDHLTIRAMLQKAEVKLISVAQPMLDDSPEGKMIDTIIASVNQFQSDINSRKTKKGLQEKFDTGQWPAPAPLGYLNKEMEGGGKVIIPDPEKWHLVQQGLKLFLNGDRAAIEIADALYEKGLRSKTGKRLCNSVMTHILGNPFYAGIMRWNKQEKMGTHKAMITPEEHMKIIQILNAHNLHACRRHKHSFLLRGFLICNICGGRYTAETHPQKNASYYHCDFKGLRGSARLHTNKGQNISIKELECLVEEQFKTIQFSDRFISLIIVKTKQLYLSLRGSDDEEKRRLLNQKLAVENKRQVAEEKLFSGIISDEDFVRIGAKIKEDLEQIRDRLAEIEAKHSYDMEGFRQILSLTRDIYATYKAAPYELKRHFLGLFWDKFLVQDKKIVKAIPSKIILHLMENREVIRRSDLLPSPALLRTLADKEYMAMIRAKVEEIKQIMRRN